MNKAEIENTDFETFQKIDMRIGKIVTVEDFPRARNPSYRVTVDLGDIGIKHSSAQITSYSKDMLIGRHVVCVVNFPPRNIAGFQSEILLLGACDEEGDVKLLEAPKDVPLGAKVH